MLAHLRDGAVMLDVSSPWRPARARRLRAQAARMAIAGVELRTGPGESALPAAQSGPERTGRVGPGPTGRRQRRRIDRAELLCPADNSSDALADDAEYAIGDELATVKRTTVQSVRIDDVAFDAPVAVIKLDIQGGEPEALKGAIDDHPQSAGARPRGRRELAAREGGSRGHPRGAGCQSLRIDRGDLVPVGDARTFVSWDWIAIPAAGRAPATA